ncbi:MAG: lysyl-tRNA synthetase class II [Gammaproteobacteria bacterium]|nr:MAG: lysyl-tRNA synthetase class II [Gammaproteobacteria bacterium]TND06672.1 MAG: lysyl-tRNA synthetase, class II [Gammaproteobacteria bacterium]
MSNHITQAYPKSAAIRGADDWAPTASLEHLKARAALLAAVRAFFAARGVWEVDTPVLSAATTPDCHIDSFETLYHGPGAGAGRRLYLQTSPEYAMKRLLAAGSGPIYQLGKVFRNGESGQWHNPEFTMLEWYRPGFSYVALMDEVEALVRSVLPIPAADRITYRMAFLRHAGIDPSLATTAQLAEQCAPFGIQGGADVDDRDFWLDVLMSHRVAPALRGGPPVFIHEFPASQAMLARLLPDDPSVAERFEFYIDGVEIANGYGELGSGRETHERLMTEQRRRKRHGGAAIAVDARLIAALQESFPDCAGVALGVDRLLMLAVNASAIDEVVAFPIERA